jgi:hypothetical protein
MTQKTNEQGQKVYEVLSEEFIRLKECELRVLHQSYDEYHIYKVIAPDELYTKIEELSSHIEDLKAEL